MNALPQAGIDEVFRRAHSLKGAARAVDLRVVENLSHALETLFARVREGAVKFDAPGLDVVRRALDQIEDGVAAQLSGSAPVDPAETVAAIERVLPAQAEKCASGAADELAPLAAEVKAPEKTPEVRADPVAAIPSRSAGTTPELETLRVSSAIVERLHRSAGQLTMERMRQDLAVEQSGGAGETDRGDFARMGAGCGKSSSAALRRLDSNPETARLARYINFVERQVAALTRTARDLALLQRRSAWSLRNIGEQLQQDVCGARMVVA